jgi:hypothetical protein
MSKLVQVSQYEQITTNNTNNISKYILEFVLKDIARYSIANTKNVVFSESSSIVEQNTGSDYNIKINPHFAVDIAGKPIIRTDQLLQNMSIPAANPRVDIIQVELGYTDSNQQSRQFIDPNTGNISSTLTYTEFTLNATVSVKEGTEAASPVAPATDSGKVKIAEVFVDTTGGINTNDIYNVNSEYGEANTGWTNETSITTKLNQIQNHRQDTILDHPDQSVTIEKLNDETVSNLRSFSIPVLEILDTSQIVLHETTVPTGKIIEVFNMGISVPNGTAPITNLIVEAGSYSGGFSQLLNTNQRNVDYSSSNEFTAGQVVQFRISNTSGGDSDATAHFVYIIKDA